jgi:DNA-binding NarL/FixJ family response regulator
LRPQLPTGEVVTAVGFYAAISAIERDARAVVIDVGAPAGREDWRLAELRARRPEAPVVVVADAVHLPALASTLRADLAVTSVSELPPLRELLLTDEPLVTGEAGRSRERLASAED